jgi:GT2 family glycosyltransferase
MKNKINSNKRPKLPWYLIGQFKESKMIALVRDSDFFDHEYYIQTYPDVPRGFDESWSHFLHFGWKEFRNPSNYFDVAYYLDQYSDVKNDGLNPLIHWFYHGRGEGRFPFDPFRSLELAPDRKNVEEQVRSKKIAVCIPVFNNLDLTIRCLASVVNTVKLSIHDVVIHVHDDCSTDSRIKDYFSENQHDNLIFTRSESNEGFTKSANLLVASHPERDVVLLNSDTVVFPHWLDNLSKAAYSLKRISSVTAMSNNATIASFPNWPVGTPISEPDARSIAARLSNNDALEHFGIHTIPTAVGSCMYLTRDGLNEVGLFDAVRFPRGYGEENQWSMRCQSQGWVNVLAFNTYVLHEGGASFGNQSKSLQKFGRKEILEEFPNYQIGIDSWIQKSKIPAVILSSKFRGSCLPNKASSIHIMHNYGGGTEALVKMLAETESKKYQSNSLLLRRVENFYLVSSIGNYEDSIPPALAEKIELGDLAKYLEMVNISSNEISVHDPLIVEIESVRELKKQNRILKLFLHDYRSVCQRGFKVLPSGLPCLGPGPKICDRCLCSSPSETSSNLEHVDDGYMWFIKQNLRMISEYDSIEAPSKTAAVELGSHLGIGIGVFKMPGSSSNEISSGFSPTIRLQSTEQQSVVRVAVVGNFGPHKGTKALRDLVDYAYVNYPEFVFYLIGKWDDVVNPPLMLIDRGAYSDRNELRTIANQNEVDIFLILSPAAETYCLTLSDVLEVRNTDNYVVLPEGNIWNERMSSQSNFIQFDGLSGVAGKIDALTEASRKMFGKVV